MHTVTQMGSDAIPETALGFTLGAVSHALGRGLLIVRQAGSQHMRVPRTAPRPVGLQP